MGSIFEKRDTIQPYEYPNLIKYANAIHESFWTPDHFTYDRDINDFKVRLNDNEKDIVKKAMLSIGVVENKVKTFWARIDMRMPKTEIAIVGHTFAGNECYSDDTEILTEKGFKLFKDLSKDDKVAQYNLDTKEVSFVLPINYISKPFKGFMHNYEGKDSSLMITPNHEIITIHPESRKRTKHKSIEGKWSGNHRYPVSGYLNSSSKVLTPIERMLISLQADGSVMGCTPSGREAKRRDVVWSIKKEHKIKRLIEILDSTGIDYNRRTRIIDKYGEYTVVSLRLPDDIDVDSIKTFDWVDLVNLNTQYISDFLEEVSYWDANRDGESVAYYNCNKKAIDKLQSMAVLGGYTAYQSINRTAEQSALCVRPQGGLPLNTKTTYRLSFRKRDEKVYPKRKNVEYDGIVYCVTVPDGNILTRRRGCVSIQGNCIHQLTYEKLLSLLGLEKEFENVVNIPCMQGRSEYLGKYLQGVYSKSNKEFTKSLILFTLLVENTSLFSQFLIVASFKKHKNLMSNFNSVISATAREENLHAKFGEELIGIIRNENPEWFDEEMEKKIRRNVIKALEAEIEVLDWIFEKGELDFLPKKSIVEYLKSRFNKSLNQIGYLNEFTVDESLLEPTEFLDVQLTSTSSFDFFNEKSTDYSQNTAFNEEDIWDEQVD